MKRLLLLVLLASATAQAQTTLPEAAPEGAGEPAPPVAGEEPGPREPGRLNFRVDPDVYSILSSARGVSTHRSTYFYPMTYSPDFYSERTEMVFQVSGKWRVFGSNFYLAYTQKSWWQWLNGGESSPFRETN